MTDIKCSLSDEKELTQCIKHNPESIEGELKIVDTFFKLSNGREIDVLAVDKDNTLVIMELKTGVDNNQLTQAIGYYDWVLNNLDTLKRIFPNVTFESVNPRIILIAENFSEDTVILAKYLKDNINIMLYRYIAIKHNNEKIIICNSENILDTPEIFTPTTEAGLLDYITVDLVKENTKKLIQSIRNLDPKVSAEVKNWWGFSIKYRGRVFGSIDIKRKYINYSFKKDVYDNESWDGYDKVVSDKNFEEAIADFKNAFTNAKKKMDSN